MNLSFPIIISYNYWIIKKIKLLWTIGTLKPRLKGIFSSIPLWILIILVNLSHIPWTKLGEKNWLTFTHHEQGNSTKAAQKTSLSTIVWHHQWTYRHMVQYLYSWILLIRKKKSMILINKISQIFMHAF